MNVLVIIPARGGSKGIPRKNLRALGGNPLISYAIKCALQSKFQPDVYVSSDDDEILHVSSKYGAKTFKRDSQLAEDATTLDPVIFNAYESIRKMESKNYGLIVTLQPTSPLLKSTSLDRAIELMVEKQEVDTVLSCIEKVGLSWSKKEDKFVPNYVARLNRQYLDATYYETGSFLITRDRVITSNNRIGKNVELISLPEDEGIDIDTYEEWNLCEYYLNKKNIVIATIGYPEIGLGHIYNTLIIANEILDHNITFIVDEKSDLGKQKLESQNYQVIQQSGSDLVAEIVALQPDIVINDRLDTDVAYMQRLKDAGLTLINFEDLGEGAKLADVVFNAIYPEKETLPNHYFGPAYFCARNEFVLTPKKEIEKAVKRVLITFGGVDPNNLTLKTIKAIYSYCLESNIEMNVIAGLGYKDYASIAGFEKLKVHRDVKNISDYMHEADVVFTSAGRTTYELAILGVPSIVMGQNEREMTHFFAQNEQGFMNLGLHSTVAEDQILAAFEALILDVKGRQAMQEKMFSSDVRNGKRRVIQLIKQTINEVK